jgi:hypothetical protein
MAARATLADALHQSGRAAEAGVWFREAETRQRARQPEYPRLYALWGFHDCDQLLAEREHLAQAAALVSGMGYHRRDADIIALERLLSTRPARRQAVELLHRLSAALRHRPLRQCQSQAREMAALMFLTRTTGST